MATPIRKAVETDAVDAITTLHRSITELCVADHKHDAHEIDAWLSNKTVEAWSKWVARNDAVLLVAIRDKTIVGVGMATFRGEILLNYVHPDARYSGVSKALLAAMEEELRSHDATHCQLETTNTARRFYEKRGFEQDRENASILLKCL